MIERGRGPGLLLEPAQAIGIARDLRGQDFDRHVAAEPLVVRPIDLAHPAAADHGNNAVRSKSAFQDLWSWRCPTSAGVGSGPIIAARR